MVKLYSIRRKNTISMKHCVFFAISGSNEDFIKKGLLVAIKSLQKTNPDLPFFVLYDDLSEKAKSLFGGIELIQVDLKNIDVGVRADLTQATWFKFFVDRYIQDFDKALYLDGDIVVLGSLTEVFERTETVACCVKKRSLDLEYAHPYKISKKENLQNRNLVNGGVVCFNLHYWRGNHLTEKVLSVIKEYGAKEFLCADQGVLNIVLQRCGKLDVLPIEYNFCRHHDMTRDTYMLVRESDKEIRIPIFKKHFLSRGKEIKILHWNGKEKPWNYEGHDDKYYKECYDQFI